LRAGWLTDIHLNFVSPRKRSQFYSQLREQQLDTLLLGGDIGEANSVVQLLAEIERSLAIPIYFVLGNHDFYHGSIPESEKRLPMKLPILPGCGGSLLVVLFLSLITPR
jgi:predicted MPP superfamily phosphohydrolase